MREWLEEVERRLGAAKLDGAAERDIAEELAQHLHDRYEELRGRGVSAADARARVLGELGEGDALGERVRAAVRARPEPVPIGRPTLGGRLSGLWTDVRFAARMLARSPLYTAIAVLVMAVGIGANTVIFIVVNSVLLQPPAGVTEPERLTAIYTSDFSGPRYGATSYPDVAVLREARDVFEDAAVFTLRQFSMVGDGWTVRDLGEVVSANYFALLGVRPAIGRFFTADEADPARTTSVAVISHGLWERHFGGRPDVLGARILVGGKPLTVIGVTPRAFGGSMRGLRAGLWLPLSAPGDLTNVAPSNRGDRNFFVRARLRDGVSLDAAQQALNVVASRLHAEFPDAWTDVNEQARVFTITPESASRVPQQIRAPVLGFLGMLMAAVFIALLIACTNVANLMLSRASARRAEMGIRVALGATRGRIVRHLLAESVLLALLGGGAGVVLAVWLTSVLNTLRLPGLHVGIQVDMDARVLAFATAVTLATGILFGLAPALQASRAPAPLLKDDARGGRHTRMRQALIVVQFASSLVLLVGGGLFLRSLRAAQTMDTGYATENIVIAPFELAMEGYSPEAAAAFYDELLLRARAIPGTASLTLAEMVPLGLGWSRRRVVVEGYQPGPGEDMEVPFNGVAPDYFRTMGITLRRGRDFTSADRAGAPPVVIVSEAFARRYWPGEDALGKRVGLEGSDMTFAEVIGIAPDAKYRSLADEPQPYFYYPYLQRPSVTMTMIARSAGDPAVLAAALRDEIRALAPSLPPPSVYTFGHHLALATLPQRIAAAVLSALGLFAVSIALIGLYGIVAFAVAQRTREFGIRIALGAGPGDLRRMVVRDALRLAGIGIACGAPIAIAVAVLMRSLLITAPIDPVTFIAVPGLLASCALLASYMPARRVTARDPLSALRTE